MNTPNSASEFAAADTSASSVLDYGDAPSAGVWPRFRRRLKRALVPGAVLLAVLVILCLWFRIYSPWDLIAYYDLWSRNGPPVWKEIAMRRVGVGDSAEAFVKKYPPVSEMAIGPYVIYDYDMRFKFTRFQVVAEDGKLILAEASDILYRKTFFEHRRAEFEAYSFRRWHTRFAGLSAESVAIRATTVADLVTKLTREEFAYDLPKPRQPSENASSSGSPAAPY